MSVPQTYTPPPAPLPSWLSYTSSPTLTTTQTYAYATLVDDATPTLATSSVTLTLYRTDVIQLPLTVQVVSGVPLAFPFTTFGGDGPVLGSVIGATGSAAIVTIQGSCAVLPSPTSIFGASGSGSGNVGVGASEIPSRTYTGVVGACATSSTFASGSSTIQTLPTLTRTTPISTPTDSPTPFDFNTTPVAQVGTQATAGTVEGQFTIAQVPQVTTTTGSDVGGGSDSGGTTSDDGNGAFSGTTVAQPAATGTDGGGGEATTSPIDTSQQTTSDQGAASPTDSTVVQPGAGARTSTTSMNFGPTQVISTPTSPTQTTVSPTGATTVLGGSTTLVGGTTSVIGGSTTVLGGVTSTFGTGSVTVVQGGTTSVVGGSTTVIGGTTSVDQSGSTTVVGGQTSVVGGATTVVGGTTSIQAGGGTTVVGGSTSVVGGSTTVVGGSTSVLGGTTVVGGSTSVVGGSTTILGGTTSVVGGTTTTGAGGSTTVLGGSTTVIGGSTSVRGGSTTLVGGTTLTPSPTSSGSSPTSLANHASSHLTPGQIAGIAIGSFAALALLLLVLLCCCCGFGKRHRERLSPRNRRTDLSRWSMVPQRRVRLEDDEEDEGGGGGGGESVRTVSWIGSMFGRPSSRGTSRAGSRATSRAGGAAAAPLRGIREGVAEDGEDEEAHLEGGEMIERRSPTRTSNRLYHLAPDTPPTTPPRARRLASRVTPPLVYQNLPLDEHEQAERDKKENDRLLWEAVVGATTDLQGEVERGESEYAASLATPRPAPIASGSRLRMATQDPTLSPPDSTRTKRRNKYYSAVTEMGWLRGRHGKAEQDSVGSASTRTSSGSSGSANSRGGNSSGSGGAGGKKGPPPSPGPSTGNGGESSGSGSGRSSSQDNTFDQSPNISQLFFSAPRWGTRIARKEPPIAEETASMLSHQTSSPALGSNSTPLSMALTEESPIIWKGQAPYLQNPNLGAPFSPATISIPSNSPFGGAGLSPTVRPSTLSSPSEYAATPRPPTKARTRTSSAESGSTAESSTAGSSAMARKLSGALAGLGLGALGRRASDEESNLLGDDDDHRSLTAMPTRSRRNLRAQRSTRFNDSAQNSIDNVHWNDTPSTLQRPFGEEEADERSYGGDPGRLEDFTVFRGSQAFDYRAAVTRSTATLGQPLHGSTEASPSHSHDQSDFDPSAYGHGSGSSAEGLSQSRSHGHEQSHSLEGHPSRAQNSSDSTTTSHAGPSSPVAHDPRRNTLGRNVASASGYYSSSGSSGGSHSGRGGIAGKQGAYRDGSGSGSGSSGSQGSHDSIGVDQMGNRRRPLPVPPAPPHSALVSRNV